MGQAWYYTQGGQQVGPVEWAQLQQMVAMGQVGSADLVWSDGMAEWVAPAAVPGLVAQPGAIGNVGASPSFAQPGLNYYTPSTAGTYVVYAGFWLRFAAYIIDYIITAAMGWAIGLFIGVFIGVSAARSGPGQQQTAIAMAQLVGGLTGLVIGWLYWALQESSAAQGTLGKRAVGIKVTDLQGNRISFGNASGRFFGKILSSLICGIGFMMAGWTEKKQGLHDQMASTLVVRK